jgi:large subunit ribosomal protein L35
MPKIKTSKSVAKRFKLTGTGKVKANKAFARHILTKKSPKRKRNFSKTSYLNKGDSATVKKLIPYA